MLQLLTFELYQPAVYIMSDHANVLVVDDNTEIRSTISEILDGVSNVVLASSGEEALELFSKMHIDLVLLDIKLPDISGLEILKSIKDAADETVVIMFTGHATINNAIYALRRGADDFLRKTALPDEILESVRNGLLHAQSRRRRAAALRKSQELLKASLEQLDIIYPEAGDWEGEIEKFQTEEPMENSDRFVRSGPLTIDTYRRMATLDGEILDLTAGEYDLLVCLAQNAPHVMDPQELVKQTRGFECTLAEAREIIRWQVYLLRQKVEADSSSPKHILNVRGRGYMWATV